MLRIYTRISRVLFASLLATAATSPVVLAQGLGSSPYSALGIGELYPTGNVTNIGMGGIGISNSSPFYLNLQNPALLGSRPPYTVFEVGLLGESRTLSQNVSNQTQVQRNFGGNLGYLALAFPASSRWSMSLSLRPYTYVNYSLTQYNVLPGNSSVVEYNYSGRGGLNKGAFATGYRLFKNIFVGAEAAFLFGNVTNSSDARIIVNQLGVGSPDTRVNRLSRANYSDVVWKLGAAWRPKLSNEWTLNLGATYDPTTRVKGSETNIYQQTTLAGADLGTADTLRYNATGKTTLPQQMNFGVSIERSNRLLIGVDVGFQQWGKYKTINNQSGGLVDGMNVAAGVEYTPKPTSNKYSDLITYRAGFQYNKLPYEIQGAQINDINGSLGLSLPVGAYFVNRITLSFVGGQRGVLTGTQVREQYVRIALGFSLTDRWFRKPVID
ncbi:MULTISPECIES: outer membrane protein transport protein [Spirosoma]|uniref:Outer membrane protein transport protein n=1 Tax=Spirosoma liriopis TaxID=2937440 RepID=A0ABT0HQB7_9BACT|nr:MULTISPECIES: outer membrane protein transport protein [Spirosoma]MCK8494361.1 outer membrane protein transport protein [Spirosoma liriopis]UHG89372.1 outer membrane protein transport protein [Spirosoma oryzicola]